jgi:hypothetical protein
LAEEELYQGKKTYDKRTTATIYNNNNNNNNNKIHTEI